jgi:hypothetical protein
VRKRHFGDARVLCGEGDRGGEGAALSSSRVPQMSRVICDRTWDVIREPRPTETGSADVAPQGPKLRSLHPPPPTRVRSHRATATRIISASRWCTGARSPTRAWGGFTPPTGSSKPPGSSQ